MQSEHLVTEDRLLKQSEAAEYLGVSSYWLETRRYRREAPPFVRLSSRCVRYSLRDLRAFVNARREAGTNGGAA